MSPKRTQKDALERQTSVRLTDADMKMLEEMEGRIGRHKTDIIRYAVRLYYRAAADSNRF